MGKVIEARQAVGQRLQGSVLDRVSKVSPGADVLYFASDSLSHETPLSHVVDVPGLVRKEVNVLPEGIDQAELKPLLGRIALYVLDEIKARAWSLTVGSFRGVLSQSMIQIPNFRFLDPVRQLRAIRRELRLMGIQRRLTKHKKG